MSLYSAVVLALIFSGLATVYIVRATGAFWRSRPGTLLLCATLGDVVVVSCLAVFGILMAAVPVGFVLALLCGTVIVMFILDALKRPLLRRLAGT
ncbi:MAG: hypothetical protein ACP5O7_07180 [Phycisphaerae bacterium]